MKVMKTFLVAMVLFLTAGIVFSSGVDENKSQTEGTQVQEDIMQRAMRAYPVPEVEEFLTRRAVVKWMERMDQPGKIFYIYIMSDVGTITHYFVAEYRPVSMGTFLTPTKRLYRSQYGNVLLNANALDGVYYGEGAGDQYFFFDAETDAYLELKGLNYIVSDQPFKTDATRIVVENAQ